MNKIFVYCWVVLLTLVVVPDVSATSFTLDSSPNGNFIFEANPLALVSTVDITIHAGSVEDPPGKEGLTDIALEAVLRGTKRTTRDEFAMAVERLGAVIGARTGFVGSSLTLTTISENLEPALKLLAEALLDPGLRESDFNNLKREQLAKLNQARSRVAGLVVRAARQSLYRGTPLAHNSDGTIESINRITLADVRDQLKRIVVAGNLTFAVDTNRSEADVKSYINSAFSKLPEGAMLPRPALAAPKLEGRHLIIVDKQGLTTTSTVIAHPSIASDDPKAIELELGSLILGGDMSSRLFTVLRKQNGWTYGASSGFQFFDAPRRYGSTYVLYTFPATEHSLEAIPKAVELYKDFVDKGLTPEEFDFGRNALVNSYAFNFVSASARIGGRIYERFEGYPYLSMEAYSSRMAKLTLAELNKEIQRAYNPQDLLIVVAGDPKQLRQLGKLIPGVRDVIVVKDPIQRLY